MSRFTAGQQVRLRATPTVGHSRVPSYVRGKVATVERVLPEFVIPEDEAWRRIDGRRKPLYRVRLSQHDLWPDYRGALGDSLDLEIFEHWLEPITEGNGS